MGYTTDQLKEGAKWYWDYAKWSEDITLELKDCRIHMDKAVSEMLFMAGNDVDTETLLEMVQKLLNAKQAIQAAVFDMNARQGRFAAKSKEFKTRLEQQEEESANE